MPGSASAVPIANGISRASQTARASRSGGSGSGSSGGGSLGSGSNNSGSRGSAGSSASSAKGVKKELDRRTCKTCPDWRYEMGMRRLGGVPYVYTYHHLFVVAWNRGGTGMMPTYSAFPSREGGDAGIWGPISGAMQSDSSKSAEEGHTPDARDTSDMGYLKFTFAADYGGSFELAPGNTFVTLKDTNENLNIKLFAESNRIDARRIKYVPTGPNSNSFAMSVAGGAGLPRRHPPGTAPGAGMQL
jgi:hypothetical protein